MQVLSRKRFFLPGQYPQTRLCSRIAPLPRPESKPDTPERPAPIARATPAPLREPHPPAPPHCPARHGSPSGRKDDLTRLPAPRSHKKSGNRNGRRFLMVPKMRLELTRAKRPLPPQSSVSTNFTTWAGAFTAMLSLDCERGKDQKVWAKTRKYGRGHLHAPSGFPLLT